MVEKGAFPQKPEGWDKIADEEIIARSLEHFEFLGRPDFGQGDLVLKNGTVEPRVMFWKHCGFMIDPLEKHAKTLDPEDPERKQIVSALTTMALSYFKVDSDSDTISTHE